MDEVLSSLPKCSSFQITEHLKGCGKKDVGDKGYKFFVGNYLHNVYVGYRRGINIPHLLSQYGENIVPPGLCSRDRAATSQSVY